MTLKYFESVIYLILCYNFLYCGSWGNLTSNLNITDIIIDDNKIYATTNGGIIILNQEDKTLNSLDFNNDIYPLDLKSIYIDSNKNILLGSNGPVPSVQLLDSSYQMINTVLLNGIEGIAQIDQIIEFNNNIYAIGRGTEFDILIEFSRRNPFQTNHS